MVASPARNETLKARVVDSWCPILCYLTTVCAVPAKINQGCHLILAVETDTTSLYSRKLEVRAPKVLNRVV